MRWKGIIFLAIILIIWLVISALFTSTLVENELESLGTSIVGAKVEIENLNVSLFDLSLAWDRLQITDPDNTMKNMLETKNAAFDLDLVPLFSGKVIVEQFMLQGIRTNTDRETDGAIPSREESIEDSFIAGTIKSLSDKVATPIGDQFSNIQQNVNVDSILSILEIESIDKMKDLQQDLSNKYDDWNMRISGVTIEQDAKAIEQKIKRLDINRAKTIDGFQATLNDINEIRSTIESLESDVTRLKTDLQSDSQPEKKSPPRLKGQTIHFSAQQATPDFWIKQIDLSGQTDDGLQLSGQILNLVSNQKQIGKPTEFNIESNDQSKISLNLNGVLDYLGENPGEKIQLSYAGFALAGTKLSNSRFLPNKVANGIGKIGAEVALRAKSIEGKIDFTGSNVQFAQAEAGKAKNQFEEIIQSITNDIDRIDFESRITGTQDNLNFTLNSNLDQLFAQRLKQLAGEKIEAAKKRIRSEIETKIAAQKSQLTTLVKSKTAGLTQQVDSYQQIVDENKSKLDEKKKEAEKILEKEKSKIKDKVQDLFKF
jgi:hypothetical protein